MLWTIEDIDVLNRATEIIFDKPKVRITEVVLNDDWSVTIKGVVI